MALLRRRLLLREVGAAAPAPPKAVGESLPKPGCQVEGAGQSEPEREKAAPSRWRACELPRRATAPYCLEEAHGARGLECEGTALGALPSHRWRLEADRPAGMSSGSPYSSGRAELKASTPRRPAETPLLPPGRQPVHMALKSSGKSELSWPHKDRRLLSHRSPVAPGRRQRQALPVGSLPFAMASLSSRPGLRVSLALPTLLHCRRISRRTGWSAKLREHPRVFRSPVT